MENEVKEKFSTIEIVGNSIYLLCHNTKPLIQISDGFDRVTLSYEELDDIVEKVRKYARQKQQ